MYFIEADNGSDDDGENLGENEDAALDERLACLLISMGLISSKPSNLSHITKYYVLGLVKQRG